MLMLFEFLQVTVHLWEGLWTVQVFKDSSSSQPSPHTQGHNAENAGGWHRQKWRGMCMRIETNLLPLRLSIVSSVPACLEQPFRFTFSKIYTHLGAGAGLPVPCVICEFLYWFIFKNGGKTGNAHTLVSSTRLWWQVTKNGVVHDWLKWHKSCISCQWMWHCKSTVRYNWAWMVSINAFLLAYVCLICRHWRGRVPVYNQWHWQHLGKDSI